MTLPEVLANIGDQSKQQDGSRFLQMKLAEGDETERDDIFHAIRRHVVDLSKDQFGNFVVQKVVEKGTPIQQEELIDSLRSAVFELSKNQFGCRVIQKIFELVPEHLQEKIAGELHGVVQKLIEDMHGNHVIQRCVEKMPPPSVEFIIESVTRDAIHLATHSYGCRVIQRLLERCHDHSCLDMLAGLLNAIVQRTPELAKDRSGNYVMQHVIEYGRREDISKIMGHISKDVVDFGSDKCSSNVVEKCFKVSDLQGHGKHAQSLQEDQRALLMAIIGDGDCKAPLYSMMKHKFGNYIVQCMLKHLQGDCLDALVEKLEAEEENLKDCPHGKRILALVRKSP